MIERELEIRVYKQGLLSWRCGKIAVGSVFVVLGAIIFSVFFV